MRHSGTVAAMQYSSAPDYRVEEMFVSAVVR